MRLAQAENYGVAFDLTPPRQAFDPEVIGEDSRRILRDLLFRDDIDRVALIDLIHGEIAAPTDEVILGQTLPDKYALRARLFADEAGHVLRRKGVHAIWG